MTDLTLAPDTDPPSLYRLRDELYATDMLIAALTGLDFFTWLDAHPGTIDDIARHFGFTRRPVDVMTTLFVAMELARTRRSRLRLTSDRPVSTSWLHRHGFSDRTFPRSWTGRSRGI